MTNYYNCEYRFDTPFLITVISFFLDIYLINGSITHVFLKKVKKLDHLSNIERIKVIYIVSVLAWSGIKDYWFWSDYPSFVEFMDCHYLRELNEGTFIKSANLILILSSVDIDTEPTWLQILLGLIGLLLYSPMVIRLFIIMICFVTIWPYFYLFFIIGIIAYFLQLNFNELISIKDSLNPIFFTLYKEKTIYMSKDQIRLIDTSKLTTFDLNGTIKEYTQLNRYKVLIEGNSIVKEGDKIKIITSRFDEIEQDMDEIILLSTLLRCYYFYILIGILGWRLYGWLYDYEGNYIDCFKSLWILQTTIDNYVKSLNILHLC